MGALHDASGGYYTGTSLTGDMGNGHPSQAIGYALAAGIKINFPMIGPGDFFQSQVNYTHGATRYAANTPSSTASPGIFGTGASPTLGVGWFSDGVYCGTTVNGVPTGVGCAAIGGVNATKVELTTAWSVAAAYEHFWTPSLRTSFVGAYFAQSYNHNATGMMCDSMNNPASTGGPIANSLTQLGATVSGSSTPTPLCADGAFNWSYYSLSSRTQWNITKDFYVGLEGYYGHLNTMSKGNTAQYQQAGNGAQPTRIVTLEDQNVYVARFRVHRDLVP